MGSQLMIHITESESFLSGVALEYLKNRCRTCFIHAAMPPWDARGFKAPLRRSPMNSLALPGDTCSLDRGI